MIENNKSIKKMSFEWPFWNCKTWKFLEVPKHRKWPMSQAISKAMRVFIAVIALLHRGTIALDGHLIDSVHHSILPSRLAITADQQAT